MGADIGARRLGVAVRASLAWYEDVFRVNGIPTRVEDGVWSALGDRPRWHCAAKTLRPDVRAGRVVRAVDDFDQCSVADSYATLDLGPAGFQRLCPG